MSISVQNVNNGQTYQPGLVSVAEEYLSEASGIQGLVIEPAMEALNWFDFCKPGFSKATTIASKALQYLDQGFYCLAAPSQIKKLFTSIVELKNSLINGQLLETCVKTNDLFINSIFTVGLATDSVGLLNSDGILSLSQTVIKVFNIIAFMGSIAVCLYALKEIYDQLILLIHAEIGSPAFRLAIMNLLAQFLLLVIGILGVIGYTSGVVLDQWIGLLISSSLMSISLFGYFYEKMNIPGKETSLPVAQEVPKIKKIPDKDLNNEVPKKTPGRDPNNEVLKVKKILDKDPNNFPEKA